MSAGVRPLPRAPAGPSRRARELVARVTALLPAGADLSLAEFERRHRAILYLVWAQAVATLIFGLLRGVSPPAVVAETLLIVSLGAVAAIRVLAPRFRAAIATLALISTSAAIVQFSGGTIEAHFHFFVMMAVIAIYQDWIPLLLGILYVAVDHGIVGTLLPHSVYNHPDAFARPWLWALIHAAFVLGEAAALLALWKIIEATEHQKRSAVERYNAQLRAQVTERRRQGERAGEIQRHLLPQAPPLIRGYELTGICRPAEDVAGDFYDWYACADGSIDFTVADVMGKGVAAALVMAVLRTALRSAPLHLDLPGKIDAAAGLMSLGMSEDGLFVTLFHARLDPATGIVRYVDAGHGYCAIRRSSGELVQLRGHSLPLGVRDRETYRESVARLEPGDALVVYSDGLLEDEEGTIDLARYLEGLDGQASATELLGSLLRHTPVASQDDITIVVLRRRPEEHTAEVGARHASPERHSASLI